MTSDRPRVAAIVTEYRPASHADVIVGKLLAGYLLDGHYREPAVEVVALYTDQAPANDLSRGLAAQHGVPIYGRIEDALTGGGQRLAVDGVLLIGEHGDYPFNAWGQHLYPRRRFLEATLRVFDASGRVVPVFIDKHLSYDWPSARWMFDRLRADGVPLLAGSSLPVALRVPDLELPLGCRIDEALVVCYGGVESYGFHGLEALQCMVERRAGGEGGLAAVECVTGDRAWVEVEGAWSPALLTAALATCRSAGHTDPRQAVAEPVLFVLEYRDGLRAGVLLLNGWLEDWGFAARLAGVAEPLATNMRLERGPPYGHFARLVTHIETLLTTCREPYPPERTLLTTGALALLMESRYRGQRLLTPELAIGYHVADWPRTPVATGASVVPLTP